MENLGSLIPTIFYDLIARISPGILFFAILASDVRAQPIVSKLPDGALTILLFVVSGYVFGFLLDVLTQALAHLFDIFLSYLIYQVTNNKKKIWSLNVWEVIESMENIDRSMLMRKYMAELSLCRVFSAVWIILWISQISFLENLSFSLKFYFLLVLLIACYCRDLIARRSAQRVIEASKEDGTQYRGSQFWIAK